MKNQLQKSVLIATLAFIGLSNVANAQVVLVEPSGTGSQDINRLSRSGNNLFFVGREQGGSATDVYLWSNDGTTSTKINFLSSLTANINPSYFYPCNGKTFFFYSDGVSVSGYEPWVTDGTSAGTMMIKNINSGASNSVASNGAQDCFCYNNKIYFSANDGTNGTELWVSDGTSAGTMMVKDINVGSGSSVLSAGAMYGFVLYNSELYFLAKSSTAPELWHTDGTTTGTLQVANPSGLSAIWSTSVLSVHNNMLYFLGTYNSQNNSLMKSDGTTNGTVLVGNNFPTSGFTPQMGSMKSLGTEAIFNYNIVTRDGIYKTDGTSISLIKDSMSFGSRVILGSNILFRSAGLWITDGTTGGTLQLNAVSGPSFSPVINGKVYFSSLGNNIWETDGTVSGTSQIATISTVMDFTELNGELFFMAKNSANGNRIELFKLGTTTGISDLADNNFIAVYPNPASQQLFIELSDYKNTTAEIFNMQGQLLQSINLQSSKTTVSGDNLTTGIYFVKIKNTEGVTIKKFVKD